MMWNEEEAKIYFSFLREVRANYIKKWNGKEKQDPYKFGFSHGGMTPIEEKLWHAIRMLGLEMYPQFPVGKYYLDFANPFHKIALEADGKAHNLPEIIARDEQRTQELEKAGWTIYRITGRILSRPLFEETEYGDDYAEVANFIINLRERISPRRKQSSTLVSSTEILKKIKFEETKLAEWKNGNTVRFGMKLPNKDMTYKF